MAIPANAAARSSRFYAPIPVWYGPRVGEPIADLEWETALRPTPPEGGREVVSFERTAHPVMVSAEEHSRHHAVVAAGLHECVPAHGDGVFEVAVSPELAGAQLAKAPCPGLEFAELKLSIERAGIHQQGRPPHYRSIAGGESQKKARPRQYASCTVGPFVLEIEEGYDAHCPRLHQPIPCHNAEIDRIPRNTLGFWRTRPCVRESRPSRFSDSSDHDPKFSYIRSVGVPGASHPYTASSAVAVEWMEHVSGNALRRVVRHRIGIPSSVRVVTPESVKERV